MLRKNIIGGQFSKHFLSLYKNFPKIYLVVYSWWKKLDLGRHVRIKIAEDTSFLDVSFSHQKSTHEVLCSVKKSQGDATSSICERM